MTPTPMKKKPKKEVFEECSMCGKRTADVHERPNAYAQDVHNDPNAVHTVCDECNYQNIMDI